MDKGAGVISSWQQNYLGNLCEISTGDSNANQAVADGAYAFFDRSKIIKRSSRFLFDCDAVIVPGEGKEFTPRLFRGKFDLHQRAYALHSFKDSVDVEYIYWFLIYFHKYFEQVAVGATAKSLRRRHFEQLPLPLPPRTVQQRIVARLDAAFAAIAEAKANAERSYQAADGLVNSEIDRQIAQPKSDWEAVTLEDVCEISSSLVDPKNSEFLDLIHVGAANIESKTGRLFNLRSARQEKLISGKFCFKPPVVLYSKIRPYLVKVAVPDFEGLCSADIYPLVPRCSEIMNDYLFWLLISKRFTEYAILGSSRAGMPKVNREYLFRFGFSLPPVKEQLRIAAVLKELSTEADELKSISKRKLASLDELKKSILQKAFSGGLL
ncbi:MAG: restriction modification system specificity subunit, type restriction enzyme subunit [Acidobacteriales bacterium]|nr:restriction modification system specificity subunit, type restriction enzyme subunit [Terriglobales bacterium]